MTTEFDIGSEVDCSDGVCGHLTRVVLDPVARAVTQLVVQPRHRHDPGRLVPIKYVSSGGATIRLNCTKAQFETFDDADETQFILGDRGELGYGQGNYAWMPYYGLDLDSTEQRRPTPGVEKFTYDHVPVGEVEIRRGDRVHASDGEIGCVEGLVVDPRTHGVTHLLLQEGHLWGKKTVAIPVADAARIGDGVRLTLTKDQVRDLPSIEVDPPQ